MSKILLSLIVLMLISTSVMAQRPMVNGSSPFTPTIVRTNPLMIVERSGEDCYDLNPYDVRCQTQKCCYEVVTETLMGTPFVQEPDNIKQIVEEAKEKYGEDGKLIQEIILNWRTESYVQAIIDLSNQLQLVMLNDYNNEGERRAAVKQLRMNHEKYIEQNHKY